MDLATQNGPASRPSGTPTPARGPQRWFYPASFAACIYAAMVLIMWGAHNVFSGFPYESALPYYSETHPGLIGLYYAGDPLRVYENHFYHLGFLLSEFLGIRGSYVPYQIVYAGLWWARGLLVFLLIRRFLPSRPLIAYVAGALVLVHSSDGATQWIGQMNQFGYMFWMLSAMLALTLAIEARWYFAIPLAVAAAILEHRSLWSYESQILIILLFPFLLILHPARTWRKLAPLAIAWYVVPAWYARLTFERYTSVEHTYQQNVVRKVWDAGSILGDWWFNASYSLEFWKWLEAPWRAAQRSTILLSLLLAGAFLAGGIVLVHPRIAGKPLAQNGSDLTSSRILAWLVACGLVVLVLSFPVYLMLDVPRYPWRTQILSGIGAGLVLTALAGFATLAIRRVAWRAPVFLFLAAVVAFTGSVSAIRKGARHRAVWEQHRTAVREILQVAPNVKPNTVVVLTNVPKWPDDPFRDGMWYDMALRLMYIDRDVVGTYIYSDGTRPPGDSLFARGDRWVWNGIGNNPLVKNPAIAQTIVIRYVPGGRGQLENTMRPVVCAPDCSATGQYNPGPLITGPILPRTMRRYNLAPGY